MVWPDTIWKVLYGGDPTQSPTWAGRKEILLIFHLSMIITAGINDDDLKSFHSWKLSRSYDANIPLSAIIVTQQRVSSLCVELQPEQIISQISTQIIIWGPRVTNFDNGPINICIAGYNQKLIYLHKNNCTGKGLAKQKWRICLYHSLKICFCHLLKNLFLPLVKKSVFTTR